MKWALRIAISLLIVASHPALAQIDIEPESIALLCVNPASGEQTTIDLNEDPSGACPEEFQLWTFYEFEKAPGADPLPYEPQEQSREGHAPPNQK
jgi:hypothetical protein